MAIEREGWGLIPEFLEAPNLYYHQFGPEYGDIPGVCFGEADIAMSWNLGWPMPFGPGVRRL